MQSVFAQKSTHEEVVRSKSCWSLSDVSGRFVEISSSTGSSSLSIAFDLVREAQERGEPVGWVSSTQSIFYPPDAAQGGTDLAALVVVRLPNPENIARAGEKLLRSGGFGLIVLDLADVDIPMPLQTRLTGLALRHHTAIVCLTAKERKAFSLGSLVSLRVHSEKKRLPGNLFACTLDVLKDKRRGPTWNYEKFYTGPAGLC